MKTLELQKKNNQKYALVTMIQVLFILILPSYYQITNSLKLKTSIVVAGYLLLLISYLLTVRMKSRAKAVISAQAENIR
jgi:hypothetical protein